MYGIIKYRMFQKIQQILPQPQGKIQKVLSKTKIEILIAGIQKIITNRLSTSLISRHIQDTQVKGEYKKISRTYVT